MKINQISQAIMKKMIKNMKRKMKKADMMKKKNSKVKEVKIGNIILIKGKEIFMKIRKKIIILEKRIVEKEIFKGIII